jgi:ubiquinone/menaquinone biosynthesis C-methylase UbiE
MLTEDKTITTPEYWNKIYSGNNNDAPVDASNTKRVSTFDRFRIVADLAEGTNVLGIASGHAHIEKRIKAAHKDWFVVASDQADAARKVANYSPYLLIDAYTIPYRDKVFDTIICTQALEYMERPDIFLLQAKRVARKLIVTVPKGEMKAWSQLKIYTVANIRELLEQFGIIEVFDVYEDIMLIKIKFND